jgi:hypothetical protein
MSEQNRNLVKDVCTVVPAVLVTATALLGIAMVMGLSSWALL